MPGLLIKNIGIKKIKFSYPEPKGKVLESKFSFIPDMDIAGKRINNAMKYASKKGIDCYYDGLPYCYIDTEYRNKINNLEKSRIFYMSEVFENDFYRTDEGLREKKEECINCSYYEFCEGYYKGYKDKEDIVVNPILDKIPNYIPIYMISKNINKDKSLTEERRKQLCNLEFKRISLINDEKINIYEESSDYFKIKNFSRIKKEEKIYFNKDIEKLDISKLTKIKKMEKEKYCTFYGLDTGKHFLNFDLEILNKLNSTKGKVLEIGFGENLLKNIFFNKLYDKIDYYGIDPDINNYKNAIKKYPDKKFYNAGIENFLFKKDFFDYIILTGSYNHIEDIKKCLYNIY